VIVDDIPAVEATMGGETRVLFDPDVFDRVYILVDRALDSSDAAELRITYHPPMSSRLVEFSLRSAV
jgi:hypothetical protein